MAIHLIDLGLSGRMGGTVRFKTIVLINITIPRDTSI